MTKYNAETLEKVIISVISKNINEEELQLCKTTNLLELNLDSLKLMTALSDLEKELNLDSSISLDYNVVCANPTVKSLAHYILKQGL